MMRFLNALVNTILGLFLMSCLISCLPFSNTFLYTVIPTSYNERKESACMKIVNIQMMLKKHLNIIMQINSDSSYYIGKSQFALYNGEKSLTPYYFNNSSIKDTSKTIFYDYEGDYRYYSRNKLKVKKGHNVVSIGFNHVDKVFSKPMRLIFQSADAKPTEVFSLNPEKVVLDKVTCGKAVISKRKLMGKYIRMMLFGDIHPCHSKIISDSASILGESKKNTMAQDKKQFRKHFFLTFDELDEYGINPQKVRILAKDPSCQITFITTLKNYVFQPKSSSSGKSKVMVEKHLPQVMFEITYTDGMPSSYIPPLYLLPSEFISSHGIPIHTDTLEIYGGGK